MLMCSAGLIAQTDSLNKVSEFFYVKNDAKKYAIVTSVFDVGMKDGESLSDLNIKVKMKLAEMLTLGSVIISADESGYVYKAVVTDQNGEYFEDAAAAKAYRIRIMDDLKRKGFKITEYPFNN